MLVAGEVVPAEVQGLKNFFLCRQAVLLGVLARSEMEQGMRSAARGRCPRLGQLRPEGP